MDDIKEMVTPKQFRSEKVVIRSGGPGPGKEADPGFEFKLDLSEK